MALFWFGLFLAFCGSMINNSAYVLFKLHEELKRKPLEYSEYTVNWNYVGTFSLAIMGIIEFCSLGIISVSSYNAFVGMSIVGGQVLATIILGTKLENSQWTLVICITLVTFLLAYCGDTREQVGGNILNALDHSFDEKWTIGYVITLNIGAFSILCYMNHCNIPENVNPTSCLNFIGSFGCAMMASLSEMCVKISSTVFRCFLDKVCAVKPYHWIVFPLLLVYALLTIYLMQITMGKLNITITIPMYFTLSLLMPNISSFILLKEYPSTLSGYISSIFFLIFFNIAFVVHCQRLEEESHLEATHEECEEQSHK